MIREDFKRIMLSKTGCAVIMAGSDSDRIHIDKVVESLKKYGVSHDVRICSAHKQPSTLINLIDEYNQVKGSVAYIAIAGGTDALSGTLSYHALGPVISCPPDGRNLTCLSNPTGSSNLYIEKPENVGRVVAQIYCGVNQRFRDLLEQEKNKKINELNQADKSYQDSFGGM